MAGCLIHSCPGPPGPRTHPAERRPRREVKGQTLTCSGGRPGLRLGSSSSSSSSSSRAAASAARAVSQEETLGEYCNKLRRFKDFESVQGRSVVVYNVWDQVVPYQQAWDFQKAEASSYAAAWAEGLPGGEVDRLIVLQHPPVYTLGTGSTEEHLKFDIDNPKLPLYRTERGGEVTYHGPGQVVMYPIVNLRLHKQDLHWYLRMLEEVVIRALAEVSGLQGERVDGLTGVWVGGSKVAAIGVRATRWVTYHGLALNVVNDLAPFQDIVPCGISDRPVCSVLTLLEEQSGSAMDERAQQTLMAEYSFALQQSFSEIFCLHLIPGSIAAREE